jgi:hypothetical protein
MAGSHLSVFLPQRTPNPSLHHNSLLPFDPCTYHGKAIWRLREFLLRNAIPAPSIGGVSAVLRHLQKPPMRFSFLFWVPLGRASNSELLAEPTLPQGTTPQGGFPLAISNPCRRLPCFPFQFSLSSCPCMYHSHSWTPVTLKTATVRNLFTAPTRYILT